MSIEVNSPKLNELVDPDATVETLASGFTFTEGPIWNKAEQCLYFSDMPADIRRRWSEADGISEIRNPSNKCNGMTYDADGNLYVCEHSTSLLVREAPDGTRTTIASHLGDKEINSPNDVVVKSDGAAYFSDPIYGRVPVFGRERDQDLDFQGVYRVPPGGGDIQLLVDDFDQPNGLCFSLDESMLYINDSPRAHIRLFDVNADGTLSNGRMFFENVGSGVIEEGIPDGMKLDERGNIWVTGPGGIWVISPEAEHLGVVKIPENAGNLNWGGPNWDELYMCCSTALYRVKTKVSGNKLSYMD
jgi:gluconolactonase